MLANTEFAFSKLPSNPPYELLNGDQGILTATDLAINSCAENPKTFSKSLAYTYWKCFPKTSVRIVCDSKNADGQNDKKSTILFISVLGESEDITYVPRHAIDLRNCRWFMKRWDEQTEKQKYVCLLGTSAGYLNEMAQHKEQIWSFDAFKTKKGCTSWFNKACDKKYLKKLSCE